MSTRGVFLGLQVVSCICRYSLDGEVFGHLKVMKREHLRTVSFDLYILRDTVYIFIYHLCKVMSIQDTLHPIHPDFEPTFSFATPCTRHHLHLSFPSHDISIFTGLIHAIFIHGLFDQGDPCGQLVRPSQTQTGRFQIRRRDRIVTPTGEKALLMVE